MKLLTVLKKKSQKRQKYGHKILHMKRKIIYIYIKRKSRSNNYKELCFIVKGKNLNEI